MSETEEQNRIYSQQKRGHIFLQAVLNIDNKYYIRGMLSYFYLPASSSIKTFNNKYLHKQRIVS